MIAPVPSLRPDFHGGSIVNLMASVIRARGGSADYADLGALPAAELAEARHVALLVVDGLGDEWLAERGAGGFIHSHHRARISSVFPPTTASGITSYLTGDAPQQHGLTGWYTWLRELGCVMAVLPGQPRYGGVGYRQAGIDAARLLGHRVVFDRIQTPAVSVSPAYIANSDFNLAHLGRARLLPFGNLGELFELAAGAIRSASEPGYFYLYWPGLDGIGHERGIQSREARAHIREIEAGLEAFVRAIKGTGTLVLVCADHGQVDADPAVEVLLDDHPELADCLTLPLCGEPRAAFCYVRPGSADDFEGYCAGRLAERVTLHRSEELLEAGFYGLGEPHPALRERIGDYTLIARGRSVIRDRLPFEDPTRMVGVHGGLSEAELMVPLCVIPT